MSSSSSPFSPSGSPVLLFSGEGNKVERLRFDEGNIYILTFLFTSFNPSSVQELEGSLDLVKTDSVGRPSVLITIGTGNCYSTGLDLGWLGSQPPKQKAELVEQCFHRILFDLLSFPLITVAAIQGHAFGFGFIMSLAHDFRIMNAERGWLCLPAVNLGIVLPESFIDLLKAKVGAGEAAEVLLRGGKTPGTEAKAKGIVDIAVGPTQVLPSSLELARYLLGKRQMGDRAAMCSIKSAHFAQTLSLLADGSHPDRRFLSQRAERRAAAISSGESRL